MPDDRLQLQRFELKYIIKEEVALAAREFVRLYLEIDEYGATQPNLAYPIHSLYLDSDRLTTYWETINGNKNRFKLRLRFYENQPTAPVYFEIKRRVNDAILKQRGAVRREAVDWLLAGHLPAPSHLVSNDPRHLVALQRFSQFMNHIHARPKAHVSYLREAWISPHNNSVRVTMDRAVRCDPESTARLSQEMRNPILVFGQNVILELKFTGRFPDWFRELVRIYSLVQCSAAKYADGVALLGEQRLDTNGMIPDDQGALANLEARKSVLQKTASRALAKTAA
ncbi:MAG: polyphosphate polymerase domain-containing protein [Verrucomicrobia bacterium]|nr:polyphosphate polymerase domain-containing protein [Verrucomicrobiota bacterium]